MDFSVLLQVVPVGGYVSIWKVIPFLVVFLLWLRLLTWTDKDAPASHLPGEMLMLAFSGGLLGAFLLFLLLPGFWISFPVFVLVLLAEAGAYLGLRAKKVGLKDLKGELAKVASSMPGRPSRKHVEDIAGLVNMAKKDGKPVIPPGPDSPDRPGYDTVQLMLTDPMLKGMERLDVIPVEGSMLVQYWVDGVGYNGAQFNRQAANAGIGYMKSISGMDVAERRKPQSGSIRAAVAGKKAEFLVHTAGSASGESLRLTSAEKRHHSIPFDQMGFSAEQMQAVKDVIAAPGGIVLIASPPGQGLTTMQYALIRQHDAFLSHIQTIEREADDDLEGITQNTLGKQASQAEELEKLRWVVSQEPDCILMAEIANPKSVRELIAHAEQGRKAYLGLRAHSALDALMEWRKLVGDDELAMKHLRLAISGRVFRQLCAGCKTPYQPDPEMLRKLNMDPARVQQLFQARTQPVRDPKGNIVPCGLCHDLRYHGRFGVYETVVMTDDMRQAVLANATLEQLKKAYRKQRGRFLQENALARVEQGVTSVQEVSRVIRGQDIINLPTGGGPTGSSGGTHAGAKSGTHPRQH